MSRGSTSTPNWSGQRRRPARGPAVPGVIPPPAARTTAHMRYAQGCFAVLRLRLSPCGSVCGLCPAAPGRETRSRRGVEARPIPRRRARGRRARIRRNRVEERPTRTRPSPAPVRLGPVRTARPKAAPVRLRRPRPEEPQRVAPFREQRAAQARRRPGARPASCMWSIARSSTTEARS